MFQCGFELNGQPMSAFRIGAISYPAFSGLGNNANRRTMACVKGTGPIPPGTYSIFDCQSGGLLGPIRDMLNGRNDWFALYAADNRIDDETFCNEVKRGNFRLHPKGITGRSEGCVVVAKESDFFHLRAILTSAKPVSVPGTKLKAYGRLVIR